MRYLFHIAGEAVKVLIALLAIDQQFALNHAARFAAGQNVQQRGLAGTGSA
jgi:hypothetical protein